MSQNKPFATLYTPNKLYVAIYKKIPSRSINEMGFYLMKARWKLKTPRISKSLSYHQAWFEVAWLPLP